MSHFYESRKRSVVKTIMWRVIATCITWTTLYAFTGEFVKSVKITAVSEVICTIGYYVHERVWNKLKWGKKRKQQ